jgi:tetratricopeptide (TPR) repeat protein
MDADRLHIGAQNLDYAETIVNRLLLDSAQKGDDEKTASYLTDRGLLYALQSDLKSAQQLCTQALETRKRLRGPSDPILAESLNAVSTVALYSQDDVNSEQYANAAILVEEKDTERNALRLADSYDILSRAYLDEGKFAKAEAPAVKAWQIRVHVLGPVNPAVSQSLYTLALYHAQKGEFEKSHNCLEESITHADSLQKSTSLLAQAMLFAAQGKVEESRKSYEQGIKIKQFVVGEKNPALLAVKSLYVKSLWNHQHWSDALELRSALPASSQLARALDLDGRLLQRSFSQAAVPQHMELKNLAIVLTLIVIALGFMTLILLAPQFIYMPNGSGLIEFLRTTRREDLKPTRCEDLLKQPQLKADSTPKSTSAQMPQAQSGKLALLPQRETKPHWTPEE